MAVREINRARAQLGRQVRALRRQAGKTLREVGESTGLSNSTLSKIENGSLAVSYDNLLKLATALAVDVPALFPGAGAPRLAGEVGASQARRSLTTAGRGDHYETPQYDYELLCNDIQRKQMLPMVATLKARSVTEASELIRHPGEEFVYVLEGQVEVHTEHYRPMSLGPGDSLYFDSTMGHALISAGGHEARILWVATGSLLDASETVSGTRPEMPKAVS